MEDPVPIKDVINPKTYRDGMIVMGIKGKITAIYDPTKGSGAHGDYEYQNADFEGEDGGKVRLSFSSCSQPKSAKGKSVQISSYKNDKFGWLGIKIKDNSFQNKKGETVNERVLQISSTAEIKYEGGDPAADQPGQQTSGGGGSQQQSRPSDNRHPQYVLKDLMLLHTKCADLVNETYGTAALPEFVATIFIEACKNGLGYNFAKRIEAPVPVEYPPAPTDPSKWAECIIPKGSLEGKNLAEIEDDELLKMHDYYDAKKANTPFAECVYQAAIDRKVLPPPKQPDPAPKPAANPDVPEDDIPF